MKKAEIKSTPIAEIDWNSVIHAAVLRKLPFVADPKNPKNEKGFRDAMILETVASICRFYSTNANIAFVCNDYALRTASEERLGKIESFSSYESLKDFESFIELTKKNLTERFVKSILFRAREKFHNEKGDECLIYKNDFSKLLRNEFRTTIESPFSAGLRPSWELKQSESQWKHIGKEQARVKRPQFERLEGKHTYHWLSKIIFVRLYERERVLLPSLPTGIERRLMVLTVDVHWKANVKADGRFFSCEILEHKESDYSFEEPTAEELERYGIQMNVEQKNPAHTE